VNAERRREYEVAVVVPTHNRVALLMRLIEAVEGQEEAPTLEVVVVDDGSTDGTSERVSERAKRAHIPIRVLRHERAAGPASARNLGWRSTSAPIVAFTDDDCVPSPRWLRSLVDTLNMRAAGLVAGVTTYPMDQAARRGTWSYWMEDDGHTGHYSTCNVVYRRDALEAVGGFDEDGFRYRGRRGEARCVNGEDTDLAWRTIEYGFRAEASADALVYHEVFPSSWGEYLRNKRRLEGLVLLFKKHPQLRARFGKEWVYRTHDAAALAVALSAAALCVRPLRPLAALGVIAAGTWYVRLFRRYQMPPRGRGGYWTAVPLGLVSDSYAAFVMLRASIRHRTLLL
jgi:glycosyltransferase involved in cell wall biosynthesis